MTTDIERRELPSKNKMLKAIMEKSDKNDDGFIYYNLKIMSKGFISWLYKGYVLGENVGEYQW